MRATKGNSYAQRPYSRGWRAPWRRQWGVLADGHCRVAKLARRIERELTEEYGPWASPLQVRRARMAARLQALAEQTAATMGTDPKSTRRTLARLQSEADSQLAAVLAMNGHRKPLDLAQAIQAATRAAGGGDA